MSFKCKLTSILYKVGTTCFVIRALSTQLMHLRGKLCQLRETREQLTSTKSLVSCEFINSLCEATTDPVPYSGDGRLRK